MQVLGVHHVSVNVRDAEEALAFYTEVLGLEPRRDRPDFPFGGAWLDLGAQQLHLIEVAVPDDLGQHFAVQVEDLDAAIAELRSRGVAVTGASAVGRARQAFVHDPSGNRIELHQPG